MAVILAIIVDSSSIERLGIGERFIWRALVDMRDNA